MKSSQVVLVTSPDKVSKSKTSFAAPSGPRVFLGVFLGLFGSTFGISSLGLPATFAEAGLVAFFITFACAALVNYKSLTILLKFAAKHNLKDFPAFSRFVSGNAVQWAISVFLMFSNFGVLLSCLMVANELASSTAAKFGLTGFLATPASLFWLILPCMIFAPFFVKRRLSDFTAVTILSLVSCFYLLLFLTVKLIKPPEEGRKPITFEQKDFYLNIGALPKSYSYLFFCLSSQQNVISVFREMPTPDKKLMKTAIKATFAFFAFVYGAVAFVGFLLFKNRSEELIAKGLVLNLFGDGKDFLLMFANFLMLFTALNTLLYVFKPTKDIISRILFRSSENLNESRSEVLSDNGSAEDNLPVLESKNVICTAFLMLAMIGCCYIIIRRGIGFLDVLNLVSDVITPCLFVFFPFVVLLRKERKVMLVACFAVAVIFFLWRTVQMFIPKA